VILDSEALLYWACRLGHSTEAGGRCGDDMRLSFGAL